MVNVEGDKVNMRYILDMIDVIEQAMSANDAEEKLNKDILFRNAVSHTLLRLTVAIDRLSFHAKHSMPEIPWDKYVELRKKLMQDINSTL